MALRTVGIYVYDEVEVLDFAGPFEVFSVASRVSRRDRPNRPLPFEARLIGRSWDTVKARAALPVTPHYAISDHPKLDVLVVPGGVVDGERKKTDVIDWIRRQAESRAVVASVCTGAFLLAEAGLLNDRAATTHWEDADDLSRDFPALRVVRDVGWVDEGAVVTSAGISAGIDMALHLVRRLTDAELAALTARQMEYDWRDDPGAFQRPA